MGSQVISDLYFAVATATNRQNGCLLKEGCLIDRDGAAGTMSDYPLTLRSLKGGWGQYAFVGQWGAVGKVCPFGRRIRVADKSGF